MTQRIPTSALREIVEDRERAGEQTIPVAELLDRLQLTSLVDVQELAWLREIEVSPAGWSPLRCGSCVGLGLKTRTRCGG